MNIDEKWKKMEEILRTNNYHESIYWNGGCLEFYDGQCRGEEMGFCKTEPIDKSDFDISTYPEHIQEILREEEFEAEDEEINFPNFLETRIFGSGLENAIDNLLKKLELLKYGWEIDYISSYSEKHNIEYSVDDETIISDDEFEEMFAMLDEDDDLEEIFGPFEEDDDDDDDNESFTNNEYNDDNELTYQDEKGIKFSNDNKTLVKFNPKIKDAEYTIPDDVTTIGESAFYYCENLTAINIPDGVITIGEATFNGCKSLTNINIPDSVTTIEKSAFCGCKSLTTINIPAGVTTIEKSAFNFCENLTTINIPAGVTTIGEFAFNGCKSLTTINIPDSVTTIGETAFNFCENLSKASKDSIEEAKKRIKENEA